MKTSYFKFLIVRLCRRFGSSKETSNFTLPPADRFFLLLGLLVVALFVSCGEDRTYEYHEKTERDHWMQNVMAEEYLWGDSIKDLEWKDYFAAPTDFFKKLIAMAPVQDKWSWCSVDTAETDHFSRGYFNHLDSYGFDFTVMTDPTGETSRQYARVTTVYPNSPADQCGIKRGDFIESIDGTRFTSNQASILVSGETHTLLVGRIGIDESGSAFEWKETEKLTLPPSTRVSDMPFPVVTSFASTDGDVVYLMCNKLTQGETNGNVSSTLYREQLKQLMEQLRRNYPYAIVLDLRLCNEGDMEMARLLASYLVGTSATSQTVFAKLQYRESHKEKNTSLYFDSDALSQSLGVTEIAIIQGKYTQGPAEWLIRAVKSVMPSSTVYTYGTSTAGQNVMTQSITSDYYLTLHPAAAYVANADDDYDYSRGLSPDVTIDEFQYSDLYSYGDTREIILAKVLANFDMIQ